VEQRLTVLRFQGTVVQRVGAQRINVQQSNPTDRIKVLPPLFEMLGTWDGRDD